MEVAEHYVYKKEVDWSLLHYGITLPLSNQVIFGRNIIWEDFFLGVKLKVLLLFLMGRITRQK